MKGVWYELIVWVSWGHRGGDGGGDGGSGGGYSQNTSILVALVDTDVYCNCVFDVMMLYTTRLTPKFQHHLAGFYMHVISTDFRLWGSICQDNGGIVYLSITMGYYKHLYLLSLSEGVHVSVHQFCCLTASWHVHRRQKMLYLHFLWDFLCAIFWLMTY